MTDMMKMRRYHDRNAVVSVLAVPVCCALLAGVAFLIVSILS